MTRPLQARSAKTLQAILDAAEALVTREGAIRLTLDAVSAESGVSKGGVQHHFRSKEVLIAALVSRKLAVVRADMEIQEKVFGEHPARVPLSMIRHSRHVWDDEAGFPPALLVAAALNSDSLTEVRAFIDAKIARIRAEMGDPDRALVGVFASLGVLLVHALGFSSLDADEGRRLLDRVERSCETLE